MTTSKAKHRLSAFALLQLLLLTGCVSYEPAILVPALNLSAEDITLANTAEPSQTRIDFGVELVLNESDSLSNIEILPGVRVRGVSANGPADSAGIQLGDIILSINGTLTNHPDVVEAFQLQTPTSENTLFIVRRNTAVFEATVIPRTISSNPVPRELYRIDPVASRAAYRTEMVSIRQQPTIAAARVVDIYQKSPLHDAAIEVGDVILAINNVPLNSAQDLVSRFNSEFELGETVVVTVFDGESVLEKQFDLWNPGRRVSAISLGPLLRYQSSLAPDSKSLRVLDLWLFSLYSYSRVDEERSHSILGLINYSSDLGELIEEEN
ncbi:MAG: PDZ domain-containing protein [Gammaproteobacteria bacterium]|nr:PDZ domain-containing protein [Gammaproteobacteria bacterium]